MKKIVPFFCLLIFGFLTVFFRSVPIGHLWNGFTILYIPSQVYDSSVVQALENAGIDEYVSLDNQQLPCRLVENSIEAAMLKINTSLNTSDYLNARKNYFFDESGKYRLYYIPDSYKKNIDSVLHQLSRKGITAGVDTSTAYPWLLPVLIFLIAGFFVFFSKNRFISILLSIFPVLYIFCNPFYSAGISTVILLLLLFFVSNLWERKNAVKIISKQISIPVLLFLSLVSAFAGSILAGIFFIVTLISEICVLVIYDEIKLIIEKRHNFTFVYIRPAKMISVFGKSKNSKIIMPITLSITAAILLYFVFSSNVTIGKSSTKLFIPGTAEKQSEKLPELEDYYAWNWNVITAPYKSLNKEYDYDSVIYPRYKVDNQGIICEENSVIYYNDDFKQSLLSEIDKLDFYSIESVLKQQGEAFKCGYVSTGSYHVSLFSVIMMLICFSMLLFIYFSVIMKKGGRK